jgi:multiple sugar transport system substrate-binding protein
VRAFMDAHPNYRVQITSYDAGGGGGLRNWLHDQVAGGHVDVLQVADPAGLVAAGQLLELDPFIQKSGFDLQGYGPGLERLRWDGKLYDLPFSVVPDVLLVNADRFAAANLTVPRGTWTWDEFRAAAAATTQGSGDSKVWGFAMESPEALLHTWLEQKTGGEAPEATRADLQEVLPFLYALTQVDRSVRPPAPYDWSQFPKGRVVEPAPFVEGGAAMTIQPLHMLPAINQQARFKWDVAPLPTVKGGKAVSLAFVDTLGIAANARHPDVAWEFIRFAAGPEGAAVVAGAGVLPMYRTEAARAAWFAQQPAPPAGTEALFSTDWLPLSRAPDAAEVHLNRALAGLANETMAGTRPWVQALHDYLQRVEQIRAGQKR